MPVVKHSLELQALAIKEQKIYIQELPKLGRKTVEIFLDIEGIPDQDFYYLIGVFVCDDERNSYNCFWADTVHEEEKILRQLIEKVSEYPEVPIYHYGSYEIRAFNELSKRYAVNLDQITKRLVNINSYIYGRIYFPVFSNSLKTVGAFIGASWTSSEASGIKSLVWRYEWEQTFDQNLKQELSTYNREDCLALKHVADVLTKIFNNDNKYLNTEIHSVSEIKIDSVYRFGNTKYAFEDLDFINKCAYFNYQRENIYFRDNKKKKTRSSNKRNCNSCQNHFINKTIEIPRVLECYKCGSSKLYRSTKKEKIVLNLKFFRGGIKKWVVKYKADRLRCYSCYHSFLPAEFRNITSKYGYELYVWIVYQHIALRQPYSKIQDCLREVFNFYVNQSAMDRATEKLAMYHKATYENIIKKLRNGNLIHADETHINIKGAGAYVWVFTSLEEVIYIYSPTREGSILEDFISGFNGVLVSDFYSVYDSVRCSQQKCLIHLIRDMNDDLLQNQFVNEYKEIVKEFSILIRSIISTVDKYGLKKRHLYKHKHQTENFFKTIISNQYSSEIAIKYQKKFKAYQNKLFTFLDYDGIPWNNNNAENAVKGFAAYRKLADGSFTENSIKDYLILLSVYKTCKYKEIDFLKFLLSKETDIEKFSGC